MNSCFFHDASHAVRYDAKHNDTAHRKVFLYNAYADDKEEGANAHGTHVAGTLVGEALTESILSQYNGIAYKARLVFFDIGKGSGSKAKLETPRRIVSIVETVYSQGARIHSASWGAFSSSYTTDTASIDNFMCVSSRTLTSSYAHPDCLVVFAAGNEGEKGAGSIYSPANGKNVLAVGSTYNAEGHRDVRAPFSCQGPTSDRRIKPDVLAPGVSIDAAASSGNEKNTCGIVSKTGTSMSTPIVAATALLLSQYLEKGYYPSGTPREEDGFVPLASTLKALLVHSGKPVREEASFFFGMEENALEFPGNKQGFGRMDLSSILYWRNESSFNLFIQEGEVTSNARHVSFSMLVSISFSL